VNFTRELGKKRSSTGHSQDKTNVLILDWTGLHSIFSSENIELTRILNFIVRKNTSFTRTVTGNRKLNKELLKIATIAISSSI